MFVKLQLLFCSACLILVGVLRSSLLSDALGAFALGTLAATAIIVTNVMMIASMKENDGGTSVPPQGVRKKKIFFLLIVVPIKAALLLGAPAAVLLVSRDVVPCFVAGILSFIPLALIASFHLQISEQKERNGQDLQ